MSIAFPLRWSSRRARWPALALAACLLGVGCDALRGKPEEPPPAAAQAPADATKPPGPATAAPASPSSLLGGVIPQAMEREVDAGNTWRVDAYVAALIVEQLRKSPLPFTPWRSDGPVAGRPSAGYRVGPLATESPWTALGLREGDIVQTVNGVSTEAPDWSTQALQRAENQVTVTVYRDDVSITLAYRLVGGLAWQALVQPQAAGAIDDGALAIADPPAEAGDLEDPFLPPRPSTGGGSGAHDGPYSPPRPSTGGGGGGGGSTPPSAPKGTVARCRSADVCSIDEGYFDGLVASPSKMQAQADVVPAISNDVFSGYKLKTVRSGTAAHQLGFRSGDKITHVNGRDLTNDAEALGVYMSLSGTNLFRVRYVRGGSTRTKTITVE